MADGSQKTTMTENTAPGQPEFRADESAATVHVPIPSSTQQQRGPAAPLSGAVAAAMPAISIGDTSAGAGPADGIDAATNTAQGMSANEIALYDRQIRLWGKQAQEKIRTAKVLLIGLKGLGNEVAKNLVLAGIGSLTVVDDQTVSEEDLGAQFLVRQEDIGKNRAQAAQAELQALNPRVRLFVDTSSVFELAMKPAFFQAFDIIIATDLTIDLLQPLNAACRLGPRPFYAAGVHGLYGYAFADLGAHTFVIEREKSNVATQIGPESATRSIIGTATKKSDNGKTIELVTKVEQYSPLSQVVGAPLPSDRVSSRRRRLQISPILACIRALWKFQLKTARPFPEETEDDLALYTMLATNEHKAVLALPYETMRSEILRAFLQGVSAEFAPTCALIGGQLAQDVIHVISQNEQPIQNLLIWDGDELSGEIYAMHAPPEVLVPAPQLATLPIQSLPIQPETGSNGDTNGVGSSSRVPAPKTSHDTAP